MICRLSKLYPKFHLFWFQFSCNLKIFKFRDFITIIINFPTPIRLPVFFPINCIIIWIWMFVGSSMVGILTLFYCFSVLTDFCFNPISTFLIGISVLLISPGLPKNLFASSVLSSHSGFGLPEFCPLAEPPPF